MKLKNILPLSTYFLLSALSILSLSLHAAVPLRWTVETSRLQPVVFDAVRGETLALEASFQSYGTPVETSNMTAFVCWQTNGMGSAWWVTNAVTTATVARALFTPEMDPGAPVVNAFIGLSDATNSPLITSHSSLITSISSLSYRAAFTLRFRHGPGSTPNALPLPTPTIDCARVTFLHPEYAPFSGGGGHTDLTPATNYTDACCSNLATASTNYTDACRSTLANSSTNYTNVAITNHVTSGYLCTVAAAQEKADAAEVAAKEYTDNATNDATLVRWDAENEKLKYGDTEVTAENVGALSTDWKDNENSRFEGVSAYADNVDTAYRANILDAGGGETFIRFDETLHRWCFGEVGNSKTLAYTSEIPPAPDYTINNVALVSTITNLAPAKARGISLHDPVRHCNWYQAVTNGVFYWLVEE